MDDMDPRKRWPCPDCGNPEGLRLVWEIEYYPALLSGSSLKLATREHPYLTCSCGFKERGERVG